MTHTAVAAFHQCAQLYKYYKGLSEAQINTNTDDLLAETKHTSEELRWICWDLTAKRLVLNFAKCLIAAEKYSQLVPEQTITIVMEKLYSLTCIVMEKLCSVTCIVMEV